MKTRLGMTAALVIGALGLVGCATPAGNPGTGGGGGTDNELLGDWVLVSGADDAGEFDLTATSITLAISEGDSGGRTPCNSYGAIVSSRDGSVAIEVTFQTEAACVDEYLMQLESRYLQALGEVDRADLTNDTLLLTGESVKLQFELSEPSQITGIEGTTWELESLIVGAGGDGTASSIAEPANITFSAGTVEGSAGCRPFSGDYVIDGDTLNFGELDIGDAEYCSEGGTAQEEHVLAVLDGTVKFTIDGGTLSIYDDDEDLGLGYRAASTED